MECNIGQYLLFVFVQVFLNFRLTLQTLQNEILDSNLAPSSC